MFIDSIVEDSTKEVDVCVFNRLEREEIAGDTFGISICKTIERMYLHFLFHKI